MLQCAIGCAASFSGVNLAGILGGRKGGPRSIGGGDGWDVGRVSLPTGRWVWGGARRPSQKKRIFHFKWHVLGHSELYFFVGVLARKVLNFSPEVVVWWTLKVYYCKSNGVDKLFTALLH